MSNDIKQVIVVRRDLNMRKSEMFSHAAHASMKFIVDNNESERGDEISIKLSGEEAKWINSGFRSIMVGIDSEDALNDLIFKARLSSVEVYPIIDKGAPDENGETTETVVCAAFGPDVVEEVDQITGHLKLL
jgi:PTH2 family peptidyl-tRNA hydrolase